MEQIEKMQSKLNEVQKRLSEIDATKFHKMVDTYLNKKYNYSISPHAFFNVSIASDCKEELQAKIILSIF